MALRLLLRAVAAAARAVSDVQLGTYLTDLRRLLKDSTGQFWDDTTLIDYVNAGLKMSVAHTGPLRTLATVSLPTHQETYSFPTIAIDPGSGSQNVPSFDVANISVLFGMTRVPLKNPSFTEFNATWRVWQSFYGLPMSFAIQGQNTIFVGPIPGSDYSSEWDVFHLPPTLKANSDDDGLNWPFTDPPKYFAAYLAQLQRQRRDIALDMASQYVNFATVAIGVTNYQRGGERLAMWSEANGG